MKKICALLLPLSILFNVASTFGDEIYCPPHIRGESIGENVVVNRTNCSVVESEIKGNVEISTDSRLEIYGSKIDGNIKVHGVLFIADSTHLGNIECEGGGEVLIGCSVELKGNVDEKCNAIDACD